MSFMMRKSALSELSSPPLSGLPERDFLLRKSGRLGATGSPPTHLKQA
jgi:hypothetical protein